MDISVSKIYTLDQEPNIKEINRYWYDLTNKCLKRYDGSSWTPININATDVNIITSSGSQTLSQYLNSQFSTIGDALDSIEASKANIADVVTLSGDQTITGNKTFTPENAVMFNGNGSVYFQTSMVGLNSPEVLLGIEDGITNFAGKMYGDGTTAGNKTEAANKVVIENTSATLSSISLGTSEPISAIDTIKLTDSDTHIPSSKLVEDTIAVAISGLETSLNDELENKQDKLLYYSEISGATPSATISVANIKLNGSVAEGSYTTASGDYSHAEGWFTKASGDYSHAEGTSTTASGYYSHAEGTSTTASGMRSHVEGESTIASSDHQHVQGKYNIEDANDKYADIIGNGTSAARSNAATVSWDGISWSQTDVRAGGTNQDSATHSLSAKQNATDNSLATNNKTVVGAINELRNSIMGMFDPITDVWTATTASSLTSIISDETYVNAPGRILISPKITNVGAIRVGNNVTDINKAFPLYPDQIVSFTFSNINNFKVAADSVGDGFNYIIEFSVISPYTSQNVNGGINVLGSNGSTYSITPKGNAGEETLSINLVSE